ncbi:hypothetical protein SLA2020_183000 [Shorea laevis]
MSLKTSIMIIFSLSTLLYDAYKQKKMWTPNENDVRLQIRHGWPRLRRIHLELTAQHPKDNILKSAES